jgi:hypothetical protein
MKERIVPGRRGFQHAVFDEGEDAAVPRWHVDATGLTEHGGVIGVPAHCLEQPDRVECGRALSVLDVLGVVVVEQRE